MQEGRGGGVTQHRGKYSTAYKHESGAAPRALPALYQPHTEQHALGLSCSLDSGNLPENGEGEVLAFVDSLAHRELHSMAGHRREQRNPKH